jgi:hypothetical protein
LSALFFLSGCGKGKAVPTEEEIKNAVEKHIKTFGDVQLQGMLSKSRVAGIDSFKVLEVYDHDYNFSELAEKIDGPVDLKYLNVTKDSCKGVQAIVKVSYAIRFDTGNEDAPIQTQWFLIQKPEQSDSWEVGMPLSEISRD